MNDLHEIPQYGGAKVAFAGVEIQDASILGIGIALGFICGLKFGTPYYLLAGAGYVINKSYVEWKTRNLPGYLRQILYKMGLIGYSRAFDSQDCIYVGDNVISNPAMDDHISKIIDTRLSDGTK